MCELTGKKGSFGGGKVDPIVEKAVRVGGVGKTVVFLWRT